ncbi:MAG: SH3 domain-containing protein [Thermomicrobiales bacterium]
MSVSRRLPGDAATGARTAGWWEGEPPLMSRILSVCLCAIVAFVSTAGAALLGPTPALAANGTLTMATPLQDAPDPAATMILLLAPGAVISIDGPPVDGFYPVSVDGYSGWMRGETMTVTKEAPPDEEAATPLADDGVPADGEVPIAQDASEDPLTAEELAPPAEEAAAPVEETAADVPVDDGLAAAQPVVSDNAGGEDGVTQAPDAVAENTTPAEPDAAVTAPPAELVDPNAVVADPNVVQVDADSTPVTASDTPADPNAVAVDPAAVAAEPVTAVDPNSAPTADPATADPAIATQPEPELVSATVTEPPVQAGEVEAVADPAATPLEATDTPAVPPADVTTQTLADPAAATETPTPEPPTAAAELTPSPTPEPTPEPPLALNGPAYVLVDMPVRDGPGDRFGLVFTVPAGSSLLRTGSYDSGWISVQYKEVYGWARAEQMSEPIEVTDENPDSETVDTREPKPGSGVAFTTSDLSLRNGPSANEDPIVVVPAGSRVILTGVMEGDFQRVTYGEYVGWISNAFLENPDNPAPNGEGTGKQENYSRKQIVKYIYAAADKYGQSRDEMLRVATCESNLDPYAVNPSGSYGLFQFIRSTWKSTPYGNDDIFDPQANAMAAGWMWKQGRKSEWVCQ